MRFQSHRRAFAAASIVLLCAAAALLSLYLGRNFAPSPLPLGNPMPRLSARSLDGHDYVMDTTGGKKRLLLFFSPACSHCRNELALFNALLPKFSERVDILAVSLDNVGSTKEMTAEMKLNFPVVVADVEHLDDRFRTNLLPGIFCFDQHLMLQKFAAGEHTLPYDELLLEEFAYGPDGQ